MLLFLVSVIVPSWVSWAHGQEVTCDPPRIPNGYYTQNGTKHKLEEEIIYGCKSGFYPSSQGNRAKCTAGGWEPSPRCSLEPCEFPEIKHGVLYEKEKHRPSFPVSVGQWYYYSCDDNYVTPTHVYWGKLVCTPNGWSPAVPCLRECIIRPVEHGHYAHNEQKYLLGEAVRVFCQSGYSLQHQESTVTCTEKGWAPLPTCHKHCNMPVLENATAISTEKVFRPHDKLDYQCLEGFENSEGQTKGSILCGEDGWSHLPTCFNSAEKCGPPPGISNGDITSFTLEVYPPGSRVEYQCQTYYELQGPKYVTCSHAQWSEPPRCKDPCVVSEEIMKEHKIQLKWRYDKKLYSRTDDIMEFMCRNRYRPKSPQSAFRVTCQEGKVDYPTCG